MEAEIEAILRDLCPAIARHKLLVDSFVRKIKAQIKALYTTGEEKPYIELQAVKLLCEIQLLYEQRDLYQTKVQ